MLGVAGRIASMIENVRRLSHESAPFCVAVRVAIAREYVSDLADIAATAHITFGIANA